MGRTVFLVHPVAAEARALAILSTIKNLQLESFHPGNVESLLNSGARDYVNHPRGLRFENEDDLLLSKIYDWYADDFGDNEKELLQHLMRYANQSAKTRLESFDGDIDYEYDWDLNGVSR